MGCGEGDDFEEHRKRVREIIEGDKELLDDLA
jgi:DNA-directed RNA polymerase subunit N (RpoN/RPB10)